MVELADLVIEDSQARAERANPAVAAATGRSPSPLRPWGMWGGWAAVGIACAGAVAHAVTRVVGGRPERELSPTRA